MRSRKFIDCRCPWCPRGADFSLHTKKKRMNEHIKRCHEDKMGFSRDDFDALERVVATKSGNKKSYVEYRGAMQHEAHHEPLHVATDGNCDTSSAVCDTFDHRDHNGEPYDGRNDFVDIDIDDGTNSLENCRAVLDAISDSFTAYTGAAVEPQVSGATTSDSIANTLQSSVVDEHQATDNFTAVCCAAAVSAVIAATNNISDDAVSRCAFFESFALFMSSPACDAFKQSQGHLRVPYVLVTHVLPQMFFQVFARPLFERSSASAA